MLVLPPVIVLGALSPWAIRLRMKSVAAAGDVTGRLYALGTAGGLVGNFAATLALIPLGRHALDLPAVRGAAGRGVRTGGMVLQACLNGDRETGVPRTPEELAAEARACVAAGAVSLHVHPRDGDGHETLDPVHIAAAVRALRAAAPRVRALALDRALDHRR